jgi:hypothetical protein
MLKIIINKLATQPQQADANFHSLKDFTKNVKNPTKYIAINNKYNMNNTTRKINIRKKMKYETKSQCLQTLTKLSAVPVRIS